MSPLSLAEYRKRDYRCKCLRCRRWMRWTPTAKTPVRRCDIPHASICVDCRAAA